MDPETRRLQKIEIPEDAHIMTEEIIGQLMGSDSSARADMIRDGGLYVNDVDI